VSDRADNGCRRCVSLAGSLRIAPQHYRRIVSTARRHDVDWHALVKQQRFMSAPQIVKPESGKS